MSLQDILCEIFTRWSPPCPNVENRTQRDITLSWSTEPFHLLADKMLYRLEMKNKLPPWTPVYCGGKTTKTVDKLPPRHPQQFRIKYILKDTAVPHLAEIFIEQFGNEEKVYEHFRQYEVNKIGELKDETKKTDFIDEDTDYIGKTDNENQKVELGQGDCNKNENKIEKDSNNIENKDDRLKSQSSSDILSKKNIRRNKKTKWLETQYSEETWTSTESDGTSAACFCMAVRGGYLKQMQQMLEERPGLIETINSSNGFTPLTTAVRKGEVNIVKFLLQAGADIEQRATSGQTPLHLATLAGHTAVVTFLLDRGADYQARDINDLRIEHYAVDSGSLDMVQLVFDRGGDVSVTDVNKWTPLFRAVCQGAKTEIVEELILRGSNLDVEDKAGLTLPIAANLLKNRNGRSRDSVIRLVDKQYSQQAARARFTRLTKKITNIHSIIK